MSAGPDREIQLGYIAGVYGIKGWVKVHSFTDPRDNIVALRRWTLRLHGSVREVVVTGGRAQGRTIIAKLDGVDDRDAATALIGGEISVIRDALPDCDEGQYYWADLEGMRVLDRQGNVLGQVERLLETGAHDVLVLDGAPDRLIPFVPGDVVDSVDLERRVIVVSWDAGYWEA